MVSGSKRTTSDRDEAVVVVSDGQATSNAAGDNHNGLSRTVSSSVLM